MPLQKQPVSLNFIKGLDTKSDPFQLQLGSFLSMQNSVFTASGRLTKRNGFANITNLPNDQQTTLTTLNDNLLATGSSLYAFSQDTNQWLNQGTVQPIDLNVQSLVRVSTSQSSVDSAVSASGLTITTYIDNSQAYYQVSDSSTGQQIVKRTALPATAHSPRTFILGQYFLITFIATVSGAPHLRYIAVPVVAPTSPLAASDISAVVNTLTAGYDAIVANNNLYISWAASGSTIEARYLSSTLVLSTPITITSHTSTLMSVTADISASTAVIWITFYDGTNTYTSAFSQQLAVILVPTQIAAAVAINQITTVATNGILSVFYENDNDYASPYPTSNVQTDFISTLTVTQAGTVSSTTVILRSVGLASKAFIDSNGIIYMLVTYGDVNQDLAIPSVDQPTYFLMDALGNIYMRLAYSNGGGYITSQVLPTVSLNGVQHLVPYLIRDFLSTTNIGTPGIDKTTNASIPIAAIYTQTGINLAKFSINTSGQHSSEIAGALHLTGGQLWEYDGVKPVEHGFHVWPDNVAVTTDSSGGLITAGTYFYQFTYEWTDNAGNLHRSATSVPVTQITTGTTSTNTLYVPTLRLTYKTAPNPVRIVGYRWSVAQQVYYQFTSITSPTENDPTIDFVVITDTLADSAIIGNNIIYTTGGVIEDIAAPASIASALFKNRLFIIDAEDQNLLWYSKQVIENVPVEMSDLLTLYIAPTTGAQGSTGPMTALGAMDDKLIMFKKDAAYYLTGLGPDNTGANNDFTDPVYITSSVGCANPNSIVLMPNGLMFQSDKGIWLLGRDLSTNYIGAGVEKYNDNVVMSSTAIPGTNQVRFVLDNNVTLVYDYYFQQWSTFTNVFAVSATLYQSKHTYLNSFGAVFQEAEGTYLDGSNPVLLSFTTSWINIAGLQGYERFYFANLLGTYFTPFTLNVQLAYDYNTNAQQSIVVQPNNYVAPWGGEALWGSVGPWGGPGNVLSARLFPEKQKCQSFQVTVNELYDPSFGQAAGQGLSLSGLALVVGIKKGYRTQAAAKSFG